MGGLGFIFSMSCRAGYGYWARGSGPWAVWASKKSARVVSSVSSNNFLTDLASRRSFLPIINTLSTCPILVGNQIFDVIIEKLVSCIFILLSRESDQCVIRARLGVASHLSTTPRWGNPAKCLSQLHKK